MEKMICRQELSIYRTSNTTAHSDKVSSGNLQMSALRYLPLLLYLFFRDNTEYIRYHRSSCASTYCRQLSNRLLEMRHQFQLGLLL